MTLGCPLKSSLLDSVLGDVASCAPAGPLLPPEKDEAKEGRVINTGPKNNWPLNADRRPTAAAATVRGQFREEGNKREMTLQTCSDKELKAISYIIKG